MPTGVEGVYRHCAARRNGAVGTAAGHRRRNAAPRSVQAPTCTRPPQPGTMHSVTPNIGARKPPPYVQLRRGCLSGVMVARASPSPRLDRDGALVHTGGIMPKVDPESHTAHLRHGLKTGLASLMAYVFAGAAGLDFGYWAALSAVIVMQISVADSLQMCWYRLSGTAVGAIIGMTVILILPGNTYGTWAALFLSVGFCAYMTRYNARYRMAAITTSIVVLASFGHDGRMFFALERVLEIAIGVGSAFVVSIILWPIRASQALDERLRAHFDTCAQLYTTIVEAFLDHQRSLDPELLDAFAAEIGQNRPRFLKIVRHERLLYRNADTRELGRKIETLRLCTRNMGAMLHSLNDTPPPGRKLVMTPELRRIAEETAHAMRVIGADEPLHPTPLTEAIEHAETRLAQVRTEGVTGALPTRELMQFFSFFHTLRFTALDLLRHATGVEEGKTSGGSRE